MQYVLFVNVEQIFELSFESLAAEKHAKDKSYMTSLRVFH